MLKYPVDRRLGATLGALIGVVLYLILGVKDGGSASFHLGEATLWVLVGAMVGFGAAAIVNDLIGHD
jgi:hypothetical protein